ncbi:MAG: ABC transporter permease [Planctomycetaceae bacterium]|nr:ABC transporter permease [Planctomycetaceae bacterium]
MKNSDDIDAGMTAPETFAPAPPGDPPRNVFDAPAPPDVAATTPRPEESQWTLVWKEFRKRKLAVFVSWLILVFVSLAIFAPLLANDRPLAYRGANRFDYAEGVRSVRVLLRRAATEPAEKQQELVADAAVWLDRMAGAVSRVPANKLAGLRERLDDTAEGGLSAKEAASLAETLEELTADRVTFRSRWGFPVFASLRELDAYFLTLITLCLTLIAARVVSTRHWGRRAVRRIATSLLITPLAATLLWWLFVPDRVDRTPYKAGVLTVDAERAPRAPVLYEMVIWPAVPYALDELDLRGVYKQPGWKPTGIEGDPAARWDAPHWLGTDKIGRDVLSRMLWGGRVSLSVGLVAVGIYVAIGIIVGSLAGFFRGWVDMFISRIIEIVIVFPAFFLILTIVAFLGPSLMNIMVVIGLTGWTGVARLIRGEFLRLADQEFVLAGRALGYSAPRLIFRHILPNAMAPVLVAATFGVAGAILTESALSFLGLGITVPTPSWGAILDEGRDALRIAPWLIYLPGFAIFATIMSYNLAGEALRDASDPRLRGSR